MIYKLHTCITLVACHAVQRHYSFQVLLASFTISILFRLNHHWDTCQSPTTATQFKIDPHFRNFCKSFFFSETFSKFFKFGKCKTNVQNITYPCALWWIFHQNHYNTLFLTIFNSSFLIFLYNHNVLRLWICWNKKGFQELFWSWLFLMIILNFFEDMSLQDCPIHCNTFKISSKWGTCWLVIQVMVSTKVHCCQTKNYNAHFDNFETLSYISLVSSPI